MESLWTCVGFPHQEILFEDRLELAVKIDDFNLEHLQESTESQVIVTPILPGDSSNEVDSEAAPQQAKARSSSSNRLSGNKRQLERAKSLLKDIRRAYYKKSLQWHPDRWVGMSRYHIAVQGAFELIHEAYEALTKRVNSYISGPP